MGRETVAFERALTPTQILKASSAPKKDESHEEAATLKEEEEVVADENTETIVDVNGRKSGHVDFTLMDIELTLTDVSTRSVETNVEVNGRKSGHAEFTLMNVECVETQSTRSIESDDDTCTDMSSITKETYTTKHFGTIHLLSSYFCLATQGQVACGGDDNTKFEWRIPGLGRCRIAIE